MFGAAGVYGQVADDERCFSEQAGRIVHALVKLAPEAPLTRRRQPSPSPRVGADCGDRDAIDGRACSAVHSDGHLGRASQKWRKLGAPTIAVPSLIATEAGNTDALARRRAPLVDQGSALAGGAE
jgi:hypothetical protein